MREWDPGFPTQALLPYSLLFTTMYLPQNNRPVTDRRHYPTRYLKQNKLKTAHVTDHLSNCGRGSVRANVSGMGNINLSPRICPATTMYYRT